ncbi:MAG: hypothetical protein M1820_004734 [Bogoriella megaspora]|nr:MAG: hypothetical protein M1820_004734 [Bogoriella megaspora]
MSSPVLLILGAGPNVGLSLTQKFKKEGYRVAIASRSPKEDLKSAVDLAIPADFSSSPSSTISSIFSRVTIELGAPNVVVFNAYSVSFAPDGAKPFESVTPESFEKDLVVNIAAGYAAAYEFTKMSSPASPGHPRTFIATGNMEYSIIVPEVFSLGVGKNGLAYVIETAANQYGKEGKGEKGFWYMADERMDDGSPTMSKIGGEAHAEFYWELSQRKTQGKWYATFVRGKGEVGFREEKRAREVVGAGELIKRTEGW